MIKPIIYTAILLASSSTMAINKCTGPDGATAYQDAPCTSTGIKIDPKPSSGPAKAQAPLSTANKPQTEAQRIEANIAESQRETRLRDLQEREIPRATEAITQHTKACAETQKRLEQQKAIYVQNLYGKTHSAQAAAEQAAAASVCDTQDRALRDKAKTLTNECKALGGCP